MSSMPDSYHPIYGTPLSWRDEQSGVLGCAVIAFHGFMAGFERAISPADLELVIGYCRYYIAAPAWRGTAELSNPDSLADLQKLIDQAQAFRTTEDIGKWIQECLCVGLDPL